MEWTGAEDISAAVQALWEEWSEADWSMTAPFGHFFEGPPSRDEINIGDGGEMAMASSAQEAEAEARAAWALLQDKGTGRAERAKSRASKQKAVSIPFGSFRILSSPNALYFRLMTWSPPRPRLPSGLEDDALL
ncbi:hypothetical protein C0991_002363 [Blastosporella zonata]|nr:hypothetical protein C0991_002363 [Blastosporella zonata]